MIPCDNKHFLICFCLIWVSLELSNFYAYVGFLFLFLHFLHKRNSTFEKFPNVCSPTQTVTDTNVPLKLQYMATMIMVILSLLGLIDKWLIWTSVIYWCVLQCQTRGFEIMSRFELIYLGMLGYGSWAMGINHHYIWFYGSVWTYEHVFMLMNITPMKARVTAIILIAPLDTHSLQIGSAL